jgi:hypothetical protein
MKRFEFAADVAKLLITVSTAIVTVVITFYDKIFNKDPVASIVIFCAIVLLISSIKAGINSVGGLTNLVELQEMHERSKLNRENLKFCHTINSFEKLGRGDELTI